jgi:AmmeMemoRadiSam system protein A
MEAQRSSLLENQEASSGKNPYVELARKATEAYIRHGRVLSGEHADPLLRNQRAGAFVCIKKKGSLRGCIGTIHPVRRNLAEEIVHNAVSAATRDPRFPSLTEDELEDLTFSVDVLGEPEKVVNMSQLDPRKYGVIVKSGPAVGLLLPDLEGVDTPEAQVKIALRKAGLSSSENYELFRFQVTRHKEST